MGRAVRVGMEHGKGLSTHGYSPRRIDLGNMQVYSFETDLSFGQKVTAKALVRQQEWNMLYRLASNRKVRSKEQRNDVQDERPPIPRKC